MDRSDTLFTTQEMMDFTARVKAHLIATAKAPFITLMCVLETLALGTVGYIEWEIVYRTFQFIAEDNDYWSPGLMGLTAAIMVIGFHLLLKIYPQNFAARFVNKSVQYLIPAYLAGIGLYIACALFGDGLGIAIDSDIPTSIGSLPEAVGTDWLSSLFESLTNPLATLLFSLGIGGLAIVNIFVAHRLLGMISENIQDIQGRLSRAKEAVKNFRLIKNLQKNHSQLLSNLAELDLYDDVYICLHIAGEVLGTITDALIPHKNWLQEHRYGVPQSPFTGSTPTPDPKKVEKDIARIESITQDDILSALTPPTLLENK